MFKTLIASGPPTKRLSRRGWLISAALHSSVLIALIIITGRAVMPTLDKPKEQHLVFTDVQPPPPKVVEPPPKVHVAPKAPKPAPPKRVAAPVYHAPVAVQRPKVPAIAMPTAIKLAVAIPAATIPATTIGNVDVKVTEAPPANIAGGSGAGSAKGSTTGESNGDVTSGDANSGKAFTDNQVERAVQLTSAPPTPRFPDAMRSAGIQGEVSLRFIVGTNGRVESNSFEVISSPNPAFVDAVKRALLTTRYRPAEVGGKAVRQLVEQSFTFKLNQ